LLAGAAGMIVATAAQAQTPYTINTDICIDSQSPATNYDISSGEGLKDQAFVNSGSASPVRTIFQLPSAVFGPNVTDATVTFHVASASHYSPSVATVSLYPLSQAYNPAAATWNTCDGTTSWNTTGGAGGAFDTSGGAITGVLNSSAQTFTWDLASLLNNSTTSTELQEYGAILMMSDDYGTSGPAPSQMEGVAFRSGRYSTSSLWPTVTVTATPEPATVTMLLVGAGLAVAGWYRRRAR
jgi:hypothetical protein